MLAAVDDHIVPWVSGYKTTQLLGGHNRFVLSTSGHIAGIVNPPGPKPKHWINETLPADPQEWKDNAVAPGRHLVGGLGHVDRRTRRPQGRRAAPAGQQGAPADRGLRQGATCAPAHETR